MKNEKLKLATLKVSSFVTEIKGKKSVTIMGGSLDAEDSDPDTTVTVSRREDCSTFTISG